MPTGYTAAIKDGITFEKFALICARQFGALIMMRDEPADAEIPEEFKPSSWNAEKFAEAKAELRRVMSMTVSDCEQAAASDYAAAVEYRDRKIEENRQLEAAYRNMLRQVRAWTPPSPDHVNLRDFMVRQIEDSIDFYCCYTPDVPVLQSGEDWRNAKVERIHRDIAYHEKANAEEIERTESRNRWVRQLRESLSTVTAAN